MKRAQSSPAASATAIVGPFTASGNPNYFKDASGAALILSGSQTWNALHDWGSNGSPRPLAFNAYFNFLTAHEHNFTLLWRTELPKFCGFPGTTSSPPYLTVSPHPWLRTGPGNATDGALKFDLTKLHCPGCRRLERCVRLRRGTAFSRCSSPSPSGPNRVGGVDANKSNQSDRG